jgi:hypothetical protein
LYHIHDKRQKNTVLSLDFGKFRGEKTILRMSAMRGKVEILSSEAMRLEAWTLRRSSRPVCHNRVH